MPRNTTIGRARRLLVKAAILATAATIGLGTGANPASAMPIGQLQYECGQAGGTFAKDYFNGYWMGYRCQYQGYSGTTYRDFYDRNGDYTATCNWDGRRISNCHS